MHTHTPVHALHKQVYFKRELLKKVEDDILYLYSVLYIITLT